VHSADSINKNADLRNLEFSDLVAVLSFFQEYGGWFNRPSKDERAHSYQDSLTTILTELYPRLCLPFWTSGDDADGKTLEFGIYVNKHGAPSYIMGTIEWEGTADCVAIHWPYICLFNSR
jgi:hypothetical protein